MSALPIIITSAGLAALVNAANNGTEAVVITQVGISATTFAPTEATTAIPGEIKRLDTIAGVVVADDTLHIAVSDISADAYTLRTFGLYLDTGVLLAVYSSAASIAEKAAPATLLLNADIKLTSPLAGSIEFDDSSFANPPASEAVVGVLRLATEPEALAGINGSRAITPATLKAVIVSQLAAFAATVNAALAGKSAVGHTHTANDTVSGTFDVARIPDLAMAKITGLVASLATKANAAHIHAMADITGLAAALALKLDAAAFTWANLANKPDLVVNGQFSINAGSGGNGYASMAAGNADFTGSLGFHAADGTRYGYLGGANVVGKYLILAAENGASWYFSHRPLFAGLTPWDSGNFNPADKAAAIHSHDWAQVTGKPDIVTNGQGSITARGSAGFGAMTLSGGSAARSGFLNWYLPGGIRVGYVGDVDPANNRINFIAENGGSFYFAARPSFSGATPWDSGNFNPADKAAAVHSHDWAQITGSRASASDFRGNANDKALTPNGVWAAAQLVAAAQAATIAIDMSGALNFTTTMTGNRTLGAPSNAKPGQSGVIQLIQDATGGRTLAFNAAWKFASGIDPVLSTAAGARDLLCFTVLAADDVVASLIKDVK